MSLFLGLISFRPLQAQPMPPGGGAPVQAVVLQLNRAVYRQMTSKKRIARVVNSDDTVVDVAAINQTTIVLTGVGLGRSTIRLTDEDGLTETFRVVVTPYDIRELQETLKRAVPSANIEPIPAGNNSVILSGTVDRAEDLTAAVQAAQAVVGSVQVINTLRMGGVQQVQLDVVVARVNRSEARAFGFNFLFSSGKHFGASTVGNVVTTPLGPIGVGSTVLRDTGVVQAVSNTGNVLAGFLDNRSGFLAFLEALRTEGLAKLLAKPRLVTLSGRQASFLSGGEQAVPVPAGLGQIGVQFEEFGTRLNFVPIVLGNGKIHLEVEPEVSSLNADNGVVSGGITVPGRVTQRIRTTVEMEAGQTLVIGGLIQRTVNASAVKVPILGDLPFVGAAFSRKTFTEAEEELVVIVTPYLVDPQDCSQLAKYLPGQETRTPDDFELFLEGILEAPRGPREVFPGGRYRPAYKNGPSSGLFPCGLIHDHGYDHLGGPGCQGCTGNAISAPVIHEHPVMAQPTHKSVSIREVSPKGAPAVKFAPKSGSVPTALPPLAETAVPKQ